MSKRRWFRPRRPFSKFPRYAYKEARGMYSAMAASMLGTVIWRAPDGEEFEITAYCSPHQYKWPDAKIVTTKPLEYVRGSLGNKVGMTDGAWGTPGW